MAHGGKGVNGLLDNSSSVSSVPTATALRKCFGKGTACDGGAAADQMGSLPHWVTYPFRNREPPSRESSHGRRRATPEHGRQQFALARREPRTVQYTRRPPPDRLLTVHAPSVVNSHPNDGMTYSGLGAAGRAELCTETVTGCDVRVKLAESLLSESGKVLHEARRRHRRVRHVAMLRVVKFVLAAEVFSWLAGCHR